jgi:MFS family permease
MMISQASTVAQEMAGMPVAAAAVMVSLLALFNAAGRAICGYISDKLGRINVITVASLTSLGGLALLYFSANQGAILFAVGICLVGFCFGSFLGVFPGFTTDRFGVRNSSVNYGVMFLGFSLGSLTGPNLMNQVRQASGNYQAAFIIAAVLAFCGFLLTFVYRRVAKSEREWDKAAKISRI